MKWAISIKIYYDDKNRGNYRNDNCQSYIDCDSDYYYHHDTNNDSN